MEQTELKERRYVGVRETLIYGVANGGQVIGYNLVRMQLTFFLVTVFGIPGQAVSLMIFFMGIWDTMNDPIMGTIVDKTRTRYGKLRPYLLFVPIPLGVATILSLAKPPYSGNRTKSESLAGVPPDRTAKRWRKPCP